MKNVHLISSEDEMGEFFIKSCVPGAERESSLCSLCIGNLASKDEQLAEVTKCSSTEAEDYKGGHGALKYAQYCVSLICFIFYRLDELKDISFQMLAGRQGSRSVHTPQRSQTRYKAFLNSQNKKKKIVYKRRSIRCRKHDQELGVQSGMS